LPCHILGLSLPVDRGPCSQELPLADSCLRDGLINYKMMNERKFNDLPHLSLSQSRVDPRPMTTVGHANTNSAFTVFPGNISNELYIHVTVRRDKFPHNKTNQMHKFLKFIL
jgi:hypothetical protein